MLVDGVVMTASSGSGFTMRACMRACIRARVRAWTSHRAFVRQIMHKSVIIDKTH